ISELLDKEIFWDFLYASLNPIICKMDDVMIIHKRDFKNMCHSSMPYIANLREMDFGRDFQKMFIYEICKLLNNHIGEFELAIKSSINFLSSSFGSEHCNFIINLFVFPEFYKLFIRENGIKLIFENVN
ncbi:hypothetical protein MXB_2436, partial [Myxobolus squamalis]